MRASGSGNDKKGKKGGDRDRGRPPQPPEYEVGYKKPPRSGQIKPGERRNPNGRPKGSRNFNSILRQLMEKPMTLTIDNTKVKVSGREAIAYRVFQKAIAGDARCIDILRSIDHEFELQLAAKRAITDDSEDPSAADEAILADFLKTFKGGNK